MKINTQESQTIEFKLIWKDEYLKTISAFANCGGGVLYIGIDDSGSIIGVDGSLALVEKLPNKINNRLSLLVDVEAVQSESLSYIKITVPITFAPVSYGGKFYKRSGSNSVELNGNNLSTFLLKKYGKTWDEIVVGEFSLDEINLETVEKFKKLTQLRSPSIAEETNFQTLFEKLNLFEKGHFKRAAVLLFGKKPQKYFIQAHAKIGKFLSDSELLTSDVIEGNLFEQLEQVIEILKTKYLQSYISYDGLNRIETLEYPFEAIREVVINALIHRDYTDTTVLQIRVYDHKIVFSNGATLSEDVPVEKFKESHVSKPFNPLIASIFYRAGFVESWGKGTNNIIDDCIKQGLPEPDYAYDYHAVQVTLYKNNPKNNPKNIRIHILEEMGKNSQVTREELALELGVTLGIIKNHIVSLKKEGVLDRVGSRKDGSWLITKN